MSTSGNFPCPKCGINFATHRYLAKHMGFSRRCGKSSVWTCPVCQQGFTSTENAAKHRASPAACQAKAKLRQRHRRIDALIQELLTCLPDPTPRDASERSLRCPSCPRRLMGTAALRKHLLRHDRPPPVKKPFRAQCPKCLKLFRSQAGFRLHSSYSAQCGSQPAQGWTCPTCEHVMITPRHAAKHRASNGEACKLWLKRKASEKRIADLIASQASSAELVCAKCSKRMASAESLRHHLTGPTRCNENHKPVWNCTTCGFEAMSNEIAANHRSAASACKRLVARRRYQAMIRSTGLRCSKCSKAMRSPGSLRSHLRQTKSCGDERRFVWTCPTCSVTLTQKESVRKHQGSLDNCRRILERSQMAARLGIPVRKLICSKPDKDLAIECPEGCGALLRSWNVLKRHLKEGKACPASEAYDRDAEDAFCDTCHRTVPGAMGQGQQNRVLRLHWRTVHSPQALERKAQAESERKPSCDDCNFAPLSGQIAEHWNAAHNVRKWPVIVQSRSRYNTELVRCDECGARKILGHIVEHHRSQHGSFKPLLDKAKSSRPYQCDWCSSQHQGSFSFLLHLRGCLLQPRRDVLPAVVVPPSLRLPSQKYQKRKGRVASCDRCELSFPWTQLPQHWLAIHGPLSQPRSLDPSPSPLSTALVQTAAFKRAAENVCDDCGYKASGFLRTHILRRHTVGGAPVQAPRRKQLFVCDQCDGSFVFSTIRRHLRSVHGFGLTVKGQGRPERMCDGCARPYLSLVDLGLHMRACHTFAQRDNFRLQHTREIRTGQVRRCDECGISTQKTSLAQHWKYKHFRKEKTSTEKVKCDDCARIYARQSFHYHVLHTCPRTL